MPPPRGLKVLFSGCWGGLNLHATERGTYIDCIHGCPNLIDCNNCCNATFSSILAACDGKRDQCEALCPPGDMPCLDAAIPDRIQDDTAAQLQQMGLLVDHNAFEPPLKDMPCLAWLRLNFCV